MELLLFVSAFFFLNLHNHSFLSSDVTASVNFSLELPSKWDSLSPLCSFSLCLVPALWSSRDRLCLRLNTPQKRP